MNMLRLAKANNSKLLCHQYWQRQLAQNSSGIIKSQNLTTDNIQINKVNSVLTSINTQIKEIHKALIRIIDSEFKFRIKPIKQDMILYRGVSNKSIMYRYQGKEACDNRFFRNLNIKKGQIIHMPEYAFATEYEQYAQNFAKEGIVFEIHAPKGSKLAYNRFMAEWNFPRASSFECLEVIDNPAPFIQKKIKLKYIKPQKESLLEQLQTKCKDFCSKILDKKKVPQK